MAKLDPYVAGWVRGVVGSALVGAATPAILRKSVTQLAKASTGRPISVLRGAAAERATLAFFGGGSRASGGGGMPLGARVINAAVAGPSVIIAGLTVKNRGTRAQTEADTLWTAVDVGIAHWHCWLCSGRPEPMLLVLRGRGGLDQCRAGHRKVWRVGPGLAGAGSVVVGAAGRGWYPAISVRSHNRVCIGSIIYAGLMRMKP